MVMERIASEFNKLQYNSKLVDHPLVEENTPVSVDVEEDAEMGDE